MWSAPWRGARELDALGFAAGERGGGLAEAEVAEADLVEHGELVDDLGVAGEEVQGFAHGHVEDVVDVLALVLDLEDARPCSACRCILRR